MKTKSLLDRIKAAQTKAEALAIAKEGESFKFAHPSTRRKWAKAVNSKP